MRETEKQLKSLFYEVLKLNELLRIIYMVNRQMVKRKDLGELVSDMVKELSKLGECSFTLDKERQCVKKVIEKKEIVREHSEDCKSYLEHREKQVLAYPIEIDSELGALLLITKKFGRMSLN